MYRARCIDPSESMINKNGMENECGISCQPIYEPIVEKCCHREIYHEVPQE